MKTVLGWIALLALIFGGTEVRADTLSKTVHASLTGMIIQGGTTKAVPITTKNMLLLFGFPFVQASTVKYFQDTSTSSYVLASKDGLTIYGTIFMVGQTSGQINFGSKDYFVAACTADGGALHGTTYGSLFFGKKSAYTERYNFSMTGTVNNINTIIQGRLSLLQQ